MSKLLDDIKRAAEARQRLEHPRAPSPIYSGGQKNETGSSALCEKAEVDSADQFLAWRNAERAARELSARERTLTRRVPWLPAAATLVAALAIGIGIGSLLEIGSAPDEITAQHPADQLRSGPPLRLRLETDLERFGRRASARASGAARNEKLRETD